jgi:hypothetical protein
MAYLKLFALRHALSVATAVLIGCLVNYYFSFSGEYWIVLAAFLASQTTRGTPLRQGLIDSLSMISAIVISSLLLLFIPWVQAIYVMLAILFVVLGYIITTNQLQPNKKWYVAILFFIIFMLSVLSPSMSSQLMKNRLVDIVIGSVIGILSKQVIFPIRLSQEFRVGILPMLKKMLVDAQAFAENRMQQEKQLVDFTGLFPEWVYESGFNPGLRSGFRYFLVYMERIADLFLSMSSLLSQPIDENLLLQINGDIVDAMQKNSELIEILIAFFEGKKVNQPPSDLTSDIKQLEATLQRITPASLELLEMMPECMTLTALVRDIKDMRALLLQLVMSLPLSA